MIVIKNNVVIIDKLIEKIQKNKVSENLIYLVDIEFEIIKNWTSGKIKKRKKRVEILKNILWENNPGEKNIKYYDSEYIRILKITDKETIEMKKVTLIKEISCSLYER